ncbi:C-terminal domain of homeodomain 1-domain-containing protein [Cyathus striatus]|nr:C-terminal domain of homeodomain 1-domain-containing protein [Cyathus striatus]
MAGLLPCSLSLEETIKSALSNLRDEFLTSISSSTTASLEQFAESLAAFQQTVLSGYDQLSQDTLSLVYAFESLVSTVSSSLIAAEEEVERLLSDGLAKLSLEVSSADSTNGSFPRYLSPSYQWLLENLHNPYPSKDVRDVIARDAGCSRKDVDSWFIDARKRIGWNALRKSRFQNKRSDIIDAAHRFFIEDDPKRPLPSDVELQFATIQMLARDLYSEKLMESALAIKLDVAVKDLTSNKKQQYEDLRLNGDKNDVKRTSYLLNPYPSPEQSPQARSISICSSTDSNSLVKSPRPKKRRTKSFNSDVTEKPNKRLRLDETLPPYFCTGLLSPTPSVEDITEISENLTSDISLFASPQESSFVCSSSRRKRKRSEVDSSPSCKRLRNDPPTVQSQVVSELPQFPECFLRDTPFGALFESASKIPSASFDELDPTRSYEIDFFDYSAFNGHASDEQLMPKSLSIATTEPAMSSRRNIQASSAGHSALEFSSSNSYLWPLQIDGEQGLNADVFLPNTPALGNGTSNITPVITLGDISSTAVASIEVASDDTLHGQLSNLDFPFFGEILSLDTQSLFDSLGFSTISMPY